MVRQEDYLKDAESGYKLNGASLILPTGEARNSNNSSASELDRSRSTFVGLSFHRFKTLKPPILYPLMYNQCDRKKSK